MAIYDIDRVSNLSKEDFHSTFVVPGAPVILEDAARDWPASSAWTSEYLKKHAGDLSVTLRTIDPRKASNHTRALEMPLRSYLDGMSSYGEDDPYLAGIPLKVAFPNLLKDIGPFRYSEGTADTLTLMLSCTSRAPLHYHTYTEAISHQVAGKRRFLLLPPSETSRLDPRPSLGTLANFARRALCERDAVLGPEKVFSAELSPGEAIFIPRHWWHTVHSEGTMSALLCHFFEFDHSCVVRNEVTDRIEQLRTACLTAIDRYELAFSSSVDLKDKAFYFSRLRPLYKQINDRELERRFLLVAVESLARSSEEWAFAQHRLEELASRAVHAD